MSKFNGTWIKTTHSDSYYDLLRKSSKNVLEATARIAVKPIVKWEIRDGYSSGFHFQKWIYYKFSNTTIRVCDRFYRWNEEDIPVYLEPGVPAHSYRTTRESSVWSKINDKHIRGIIYDYDVQFNRDPQTTPYNLPLIIDWDFLSLDDPELKPEDKNILDQENKHLNCNYYMHSSSDYAPYDKVLRQRMTFGEIEAYRIFVPYRGFRYIDSNPFFDYGRQRPLDYIPERRYL